jgi:opacity protein-like surface antigen
LSEYDEPGVDRKDQTMTLGAGLVWSPLRWLSFNFSYTFTDFNTDSVLDDYQEHRAFISTTLRPSEPLQLNPSTPRQVLEGRLFN